jgi:hypothetical protein
MALDEKQPKIIGRAEILSFPEVGIEGVYARIDTGATTSSIWASSTQVIDDKLHVVLFGDRGDLKKSQPIIFDTFERIAVASSTGHVQYRFKVRLLVKLKGKKIRAQFTLADRSTQVYPVLIGRNVLRGKFVVDVKRGKALQTAEKERSLGLQSSMADATKEEA